MSNLALRQSEASYQASMRTIIIFMPITCWSLFCFFNLDQTPLELIPESPVPFTPPIHQSYEWSSSPPPSAGKPVSLAHLARGGVHGRVLAGTV